MINRKIVEEAVEKFANAGVWQCPKSFEAGVIFSETQLKYCSKVNKLLKDNLKFLTTLCNKGFNEYSWREGCGLELEIIEYLELDRDEYIRDNCELLQLEADNFQKAIEIIKQLQGELYLIHSQYGDRQHARNMCVGLKNSEQFLKQLNEQN